jgi:hypothetical protein
MKRLWVTCGASFKGTQIELFTCVWIAETKEEAISNWVKNRQTYFPGWAHKDIETHLIPPYMILQAAKEMGDATAV